MENNKETIICPNCGTIQEATVDRDVPFAVLIHDCEKCGYKIMESEWEIVKPTISGPIQKASEETINGLLKAMMDGWKASEAMTAAFKKATESILYHGYSLKLAMRFALETNSLYYGGRLDKCFVLFRWYWRIKMNRANAEINRLSTDIETFQKEFPDICKPT